MEYFINSRFFLERKIKLRDIDIEMINPEDFIIFYTGFPKSEGYGKKRYFTEHPQLSKNLIHAIIDKQIALIGIEKHIPLKAECLSS